MTCLILIILILNIYPTELQFNKPNSSDTEASFLDLDLYITNDIVSSTIYDTRDDLNFRIVFHFLMEMFLAPLPMMYTFRNLYVLLEYNLEKRILQK